MRDYAVDDVAERQPNARCCQVVFKKKIRKLVNRENKMPAPSNSPINIHVDG